MYNISLQYCPTLYSNVQNIFFIIIRFENSCAAIIFVETWYFTFLFFKDSLNRKFKRTAFVWNRNYKFYILFWSV